MPTPLPFEIPYDPGIGGIIDDPSAGPHKPGGGGGGPYDPALGGFGAFGSGGFGYGQQGFNPFLGAAGMPQRRRRQMGMYASATPDPATQFASLAAPSPSMMSGAPTEGPAASSASGGAPAIPGGFDIIGWLKSQKAAAAAGGGGGTPANDVDLILAGKGQGQWSWEGDPAARAALAAQAYAHAKDMEQSALLGTQIDTQDPWLRAFSRTQGRLQGQRQAAATLRNYDTEQIDYIKNLAAQLFMAKLGQYYTQQNKPKQGGWGNVVGDIGGTALGAWASAGFPIP